METKLKTQVLVVIFLTYFLNFVQMETEKVEEIQITDTKENLNIESIIQHLLRLSEIVELLDDDTDKLHKGFDHQAEIIYGFKNKRIEDEKTETKEIPHDTNEKLQEFFRNYNQQFIDFKANTRLTDFLNDNENSLWKQIEQITDILKSLNQCLETLPHQNFNKTNEILEDLENRLDILEQEMDQFDENEEDLDINYEKLSQFLIKLTENVDTQNQYLDNLEKQLLLIQGASRTLDDYVVKKTERHNWRLNNRGHNRHEHNLIRYTI